MLDNEFCEKLEQVPNKQAEMLKSLEIMYYFGGVNDDVCDFACDSVVLLCICYA